MSAGKTTTTTFEYDTEGRVLKKTTVEVEWPEAYRNSGQWWQPPQYPWWQYPLISSGGGVTSDAGPILINGTIPMYDAAT